MALVWAQEETVVLAKRPSQSRNRVYVLATEWDHSNQCFLLSSRIVVPVAAGAELLTGGSVLDSETGLLRSYLVVGKAESIYICGLDFEREKPDTIAKLSLGNSSWSATSGAPNCCIEDCWLIDGPIVVAVRKGQLLLVTSEASHRSTGFHETKKDLQSETVNMLWIAHTLSLPESIEHQALTIHFCGDIKSYESQEIIFSLNESSGKRLRTSSASPERYFQSWSFYTLNMNTRGPIASQESDGSKTLKLTLSNLIPTELDPKLIACIQPVAVEPCTTAENSDYLFIGTKDRRLLKSSHAQIVQVLHLETIPSKLQFGVVSGGQGVLLVVLDGSEQKMLAVCPESLEILQDWSNVWRVVVGDFTSCGHDQIVLLQFASGLSSEDGLCTPIAQRELNFTVVHGFSTVTCEGIQQGSQQHLAETKAIDDCKVSGMETICKALQRRVEAGQEQLQVAKNERDTKKELVRISSCLMQNLVTRSAFEQNTDASSEGDSGPKSFSRKDRLELVRATKRWNRVCGMNWFFVVEIEMTAEARPGGALRNVSLLLTSPHCLIKGKSSVLKSLNPGDKTACLVVCIPYHECSLRPGLPFDVSVRASMFPRGGKLPKGSDTSGRVAGEVYTQCLGACEVVYPTVTPYLEPREACTVVDQVGEQVQFVIAAKSVEHLSHLTGYMQSTLRMQEIPGDESELKDTLVKRWFNLCSIGGHGPYVANLCYLGLHAVIKLRAIDADFLLTLEETAVELFTHHQFEIVSRIIPNEALGTLDDFVKTLSKHLALRDSLMRKRDTEKSKEGRYVSQKLDIAVDEKFCDIWASLL